MDLINAREQMILDQKATLFALKDRHFKAQLAESLLTDDITTQKMNIFSNLDSSVEFPPSSNFNSRSKTNIEKHRFLANQMDLRGESTQIENYESPLNEDLKVGVSSTITQKRSFKPYEAASHTRASTDLKMKSPIITIRDNKKTTYARRKSGR